MFTTRSLSRSTLALTLALVAIGGFTRGSGSGYGCKDRWPLCDNGLVGGFLPRAEYHMIIEWTHRWVAAVVGILAVTTAVAAWRNYRKQLGVWLPAIVTVAVIGVQAWVGRLVVKGDLDADLVSVHLAISMTIVGLLAVVVARTAPITSNRQTYNRLWTVQLGIGAAGAFLLLLLGSYVHNLYISGWPLVTDTFTPDLSNRYVLVHFLHRALAGLGLIYVLYLVRIVKQQRRSETERLLVYGAAAAYLMNVGLGAAHVFTRVSSSVLVATHLLLAALVWAFLVGAGTITSMGKSEASSPQGEHRWDHLSEPVG